jgi:hypothetical protein
MKIEMKKYEYKISCIRYLLIHNRPMANVNALPSIRWAKGWTLRPIAEGGWESWAIRALL